MQYAWQVGRTGSSDMSGANGSMLTAMKLACLQNSKSELKNVKKRMACFRFVIFLRFDCEIQITVPLFPNASAASLPWQRQQ
jgi:hypothetical protein